MSNELTVFIRPSFAKVAGDPCKAALFDHILYQIAKKAKGQPREAIQEGKFTYYKTNEELTQLMVNTWGLCKVRNAVNDLIESGLLGRSRSPWGADRTKHFYFGQEQCKKLLELCQKHTICLHKIGLAPEVIQLIILSNGNDESIKCSCEQMIKSSNGNDESIKAITTNTTKITLNKENNERKNATSRQRANVATEQEATHPSMHASLSQSKNFSFSSSPEEKPEEVEFSPEEQKVYDFGKKDLFKAKPPAKTAKLKSECAELVEHIKTQEQFDSLLAFVRSLPYIKGQIHIKNLVNGLNGWLQPQQAPSTPSSPRQKPNGPHIAQQPTKSQEEIDRENEESIARWKAKVAARKLAQQQGAKAG